MNRAKKQAQVDREIGHLRKLIFHVRNARGGIKATILAVVINDQVEIGWSMCRKGDKFSRAEALLEAFSKRASLSYVNCILENDFTRWPDTMPRCVREELPLFKLWVKIYLNCEPKQQVETFVKRVLRHVVNFYRNMIFELSRV